MASIENDDLLKELCLWDQSEKIPIERSEKGKASDIYCNFVPITNYIHNKIKVLNINDFEELMNFFEQDVIKTFSHSLVALITISAEKDQPSKKFETVNTTGKKKKSSD